MQRLSCPPIPMRRTVFVCALLWLLLASHIPASAQVENTERGQVAVARLNLRTTPALSAPIAGPVDPGDGSPDPGPQRGWAVVPGDDRRRAGRLALCGLCEN
jgi:hypothetical protein